MVLLLLSLLCLSAFPLPTFSHTLSDCSSGLGPLAPVNGSLLAHWYNNSAFAPASNSAFSTNSTFAYSPSLSVSFPSSLPTGLFNAAPAPLSFQLHGFLLAPSSAAFRFTCRCNDTQMQVLMWIDDHLMCPEDENNAGLVIPAVQGQLLHIRIEAIQMTAWTPQSTPHLEVRWSTDFGLFTPIPASALLGCLPPSRVAQADLHAVQLQTGWDRLYHLDLLTATLLPHGLALTFALYQFSTQTFQTGFTTQQAVNGTESTTPILLIGNRTWYGETEHPYQSVQLRWQSLTIDVETTTERSSDALTLLVSGVGSANWSDYRVLVFSSFMWGRAGQCQLLDGGQKAQQPFTLCQAAGITPSIPVFASAPVAERHLAGVNETIVGPFQSFAFPASSSRPPQLAFSTGTAQPLSVSQQRITEAASAFSASPCLPSSLLAASSPLLEEECNLLQTVLSWLAIFTPFEGIVVVVTRDWDFGWGYVLFEWDSFFSVVMLSTLFPHPSAKQLAVATFLQVVKSRTINADGLGFIPNYVSGTRASRDRTEPPIASRVLLELVQTYGWDDPDMKWLVDLCYDDILTENTWMWTHRRLEPLKLIALGSDPNPPVAGDVGVNNMFAARLESGLDNSPMYDIPDELFDNVTSHLMQMYDVGMNSVFILACRSLLQLTQATGVGSQHAAMLQARHDEMALLAAHLWDDEQGLYVNRLSGSGEFSRRLSPTSFFPMIAELPSVSQADSMVLHHLMNDDEFCVTPTCPAVPVPSIARNDANFTDQSYWRGRHWGPHTMLVYWALSADKYADSGVVRMAREQLARQAGQVWQYEWRTLRHVHENYAGDSPLGLGCNVWQSFPLYSWGALNPFVNVLEAKQQLSSSTRARQRQTGTAATAEGRMTAQRQ